MSCSLMPILHLHDLYDSALDHLQAFLGYHKLFVLRQPCFIVIITPDSRPALAHILIQILKEIYHMWFPFLQPNPVTIAPTTNPNVLLFSEEEKFERQNRPSHSQIPTCKDYLGSLGSGDA